MLDLLSGSALVVSSLMIRYGYYLVLELRHLLVRLDGFQMCKVCLKDSMP